jgi:hypothetical protein
VTGTVVKPASQPRDFPLGWWKGTKVRIYEHGFVIRSGTWLGRFSEEEFRLTESGKLLTRVLK